MPAPSAVGSEQPVRFVRRGRSARVENGLYGMNLAALEHLATATSDHAGRQADADVNCTSALGQNDGPSKGGISGTGGGVGDEHDEGIGTQLGRAAQAVVGVTGVAGALLNPLGGPAPPGQVAPQPEEPAMVRSVDQMDIAPSAASTLYTRNDEALEELIQQEGDVLEAELEEKAHQADKAMSTPEVQETTLVLDDAEMQALFGDEQADESGADFELDNFADPEEAQSAELDALFGTEEAAAAQAINEAEAVEVDALFGSEADVAGADFFGGDESAAAGFEAGFFGDPGGDPGGPGMEGGF